MKTSTTWILEHGIFSEFQTEMADAIIASGSDLVFWKDDWMRDNHIPNTNDRNVVFHGSLNIASWISKSGLIQPGSYCDVNKFLCSSWYHAAQKWLLHKNWRIETIKDIVSNKELPLEFANDSGLVFVRPNSPLKEFSGRVINHSEASLATFDYGFYHEDENLLAVIAPVRNIAREWRYIVVGKDVVAGSSYNASNRRHSTDDSSGSPWAFADAIAKEIDPPQDVYILDICESDGDLYLLELGPFGGCDLYACSRRDAINAINNHIVQNQ